MAPWGLSLPEWGWGSGEMGRCGNGEMWSLAPALGAVAPFPEHLVTLLNVEV